MRTSDSLDEEARALLENTAAEIHTALSQQDEAHLEAHSLTDRLRDSVQEFEAEHPNVASVLNRMIDVLAQMGI